MVACFASCYLVTFWALIVSAGSMGVNYYNTFSAYQETGGKRLSGLYELGRDWQKGPCLDLEVSEFDYRCQPGEEPGYERIFYGLGVACDCVGISDRWISTDNEFVKGASCDKNQTRAGCRRASPRPPHRMHLLENKRPICGRRSEIPFAKAVRPVNNGTGYECPNGYRECIDDHIKQDPESALCYDIKEGKAPWCPITDIQFLPAGDAATF